MTKTIPEQKAKQGRRGSHVLMVLLAALVLAMVGWAVLEMWGEQIDTPAIEEPGGISQ